MKAIAAILLLAVLAPIAWAQDEPEADGLDELDKAVLVELVRRQRAVIERLEERIEALEADNRDEDPPRRPETHRRLERMMRSMPRDITPSEGEDWSLWQEDITAWLRRDLIGDTLLMELQVRQSGDQEQRGSVPIEATSWGTAINDAFTDVNGERIEIAVARDEVDEDTGAGLFIDGGEGRYLVRCTISHVTLGRISRNGPWQVVVVPEDLELVRKIEPPSARPAPRNETERERRRREAENARNRSRR